MSNKAKNILFIMCDQLRYDYLGCTGHPSIQTPNIDALAAKGVIFNRSYAQASICGPLRASFFTGRYMFCHGANWNLYPLRVDELTMGDILRPLGMRVALVGKTHMMPDLAGLERLGVDPNSAKGTNVMECGFEAFEHDDGLHPDPFVPKDLNYNAYLSRHGFDSQNPWNEVANAAAGKDGEILSGWQMRNAGQPARVPDEHSETAYMTDRAMNFMDEASDDPWCLHLSYIKPHWPYIVSEPYHKKYGPADFLPPQRTEEERRDPHPVHEAFMKTNYSRNFARDEVRATVLPAYMGLISQIDDHLGRLFAHMEEIGRMEDTMIVFTSDHGDYLGDHWLGEKDMHHDPSIRIPLIIYDPSPEADKTRGTEDSRFIETIDLLPTFYEVAGGLKPPFHLEGRSLMPLIQDENIADWREEAFCEIDYSLREEAREILGQTPERCRGFIIVNENWKYVIYEEHDSLLYNLADDPMETVDLAQDPQYEAVRRELHEKIFTWLRRRRTRITVSDEEIIGKLRNSERDAGLLIGNW